jgi:hypothetical protein
MPFGIGTDNLSFRSFYLQSIADVDFDSLGERNRLFSYS